ncbi:MAG TPA: sporulation integral membrane protein YlbJ, partial [Acetivibrio sp.]|nr:sporulation integral membrane protein YlbJ [Acetivibrio sp.]
IQLWLGVVFPSLFPFFVVSEILNKTRFINAIGVLLEPVMRPLFNVPGCGSFALAMGITSGYPVGAKITAGMREENLLTKTESERLLSFTNNSGPLFIVGAVAVGMFKMPELGVLLLLCHMLASITVGILFRFYGRNNESTRTVSNEKLLVKFKKELSKSSRQNINLGIILTESIKNSVSVMLAIGGFIILFSVIINVLIDIGFISSLSDLIYAVLSLAGIPKEMITALVSGFFEITTGTNMACNVGGIALIDKLAAVSLILGWAGISVHSQVYSIISKTDISIKPYLFGKMLHGIFAAVYMSIAARLPHTAPLMVKSVFNERVMQSEFPWINLFLYSLKNMLFSLAVIIVFIVTSLIFSVIKELVCPKKF